MFKVQSSRLRLNLACIPLFDRPTKIFRKALKLSMKFKIQNLIFKIALEFGFNSTA